MSAADARARSMKMLDEKGARVKQYVQATIESAISEGKTSVSLDIDASDHLRLKAFLQALDYSVNCGSDQRDTWFSVSW